LKQRFGSRAGRILCGRTCAPSRQAAGHLRPRVVNVRAPAPPSPIQVRLPPGLVHEGRWRARPILLGRRPCIRSVDGLRRRVRAGHIRRAGRRWGRHP
jgi:hypothetical protein